MDLTQILQMGNYTAFVWGCYGLTFAVLIWNGIAASRRLAAEKQGARRRALAQQEHR